MTLNIDLQPTLLDFAGVKPPEATHGKSLTALLERNRQDFRGLFFLEHHFPDGAWIPSSEGIRTQRWKYIRYTDNAGPYEELYDLMSDPHETQNLIGRAQYSRELTTLRNFQQAWRESVHTPNRAWRDPFTLKDLHRNQITQYA